MDVVTVVVPERVDVMEDVPLDVGVDVIVVLSEGDPEEDPEDELLGDFVVVTVLLDVPEPLLVIVPVPEGDTDAVTEDVLLLVVVKLDVRDAVIVRVTDGDVEGDVDPLEDAEPEGLPLTEDDPVVDADAVDETEYDADPDVEPLAVLEIE